MFFWIALALAYAATLVALVFLFADKVARRQRVGCFIVEDDDYFIRAYENERLNSQDLYVTEVIDLRLNKNEKHRSMATSMCTGYPCFYYVYNDETIHSTGDAAAFRKWLVDLI